MCEDVRDRTSSFVVRSYIMATGFIEENPTLYEYRRKRNNYMVYCAINIFIVTNFTITKSPSKSERLKVKIIFQCLNIRMYIKSKSSQNLDDTKQCSSQMESNYIATLQSQRFKYLNPSISDYSSTHQLAHHGFCI